MSIDHKSTAKATIRDLFAVYGRAGTRALISEVVMEAVPQRRGRPTRDEKVARLVARTLTDVFPVVAAAEQTVLDTLTKE